MPFSVSCITTTASFDANSERNCLHIPHGSVFSCDEETIANGIRQLVSLLPANNDDVAYADCEDDLNRACADMEAEAADAVLALTDIADDGLFMEVKSEFAKSVVTGLLKINGTTVGAVANRTVRFDDEGEALNRYRYNFMGGMLPFGLGVLYARYGRKMTKWGYASLFVMSSLLVCVLSNSFLGWTFVPAFVCTASVGFVKILDRSTFVSIKTFLIWMGSISAALFICHPITRKIFIPISKNGDYYAGFLLYVISSICLAWLFNKLIKRVPLK
jgi:hypothetical protein